MAGIYIHIPFCHKACHYCDFHFSTSMSYRDRMLEALLLEIKQRKDFLGGDAIETIYFGGGTPSVFSHAQLDLLFKALYESFIVSSNGEITLEGNPDDLTPEYISNLKYLPVNRLSIGVQSFFNEHLTWMNRSHTEAQAMKCIEDSLQAGYDNLTIDLIYGFASLSDQQWLHNLTILENFGIKHFSAYCLTIEDRTAFASFQKRDGIKLAPDEKGERHFQMLQEFASSRGFRHYEISNLCRDDAYSRHNTAYWSGEKYLGIGPSAHSFDGSARCWNISNNALYMQGAESGSVPTEFEFLDPNMQFNELVMTSLRMDSGLDLNRLKSIDVQFVKKEAAPFIKDKLAIVKEDKLVLTGRGRLYADRIASALFKV